MDHYRKKAATDGVECITVFSGDLLGPSFISTIAEGEQMVPSFNRCKVDVACLGNHEFDYGIEQMDKVLGQTVREAGGTCQWIMSNLVAESKDPNSNEAVACVQRTAVVERAGIKIGFIGIGEREWIDLLDDLEEKIVYTNYKRTSLEYIKKLREEQGCDYIVAVTHMRMSHDAKFAEQIPGVDIVLGGHDHDYHVQECLLKPKDSTESSQTEKKVVPLVKSGKDYKEMSEIHVTFGVSEPEFISKRDMLSNGNKNAEFN